jgi:hypothetical protein
MVQAAAILSVVCMIGGVLAFAFLHLEPAGEAESPDGAFYPD